MFIHAGEDSIKGSLQFMPVGLMQRSSDLETFNNAAKCTPFMPAFYTISHDFSWF